MDAILLDGVSYRYPNQDRLALSDVSLRVKRGESVFITGRSGSGKSTLARAVTAVIPSMMGGEMDGTVRVMGRDTDSLTPGDLAADVGYVFQNPESQFFTLNVNSEVSMGPDALQLDKREERVEDALRRVGMEHKRYESVFNLSEGEKQRVAIASQLSMSPEILLMDEPTSNLDQGSTDDLFSVLKNLRDKTLILIDHRTYRVPEVFDRVVVMDEGTIVEETDTDNLLDPEFRERYGLRSPSPGFNQRSCGGRGLRPSSQVSTHPETKEDPVLRVMNISHTQGDFRLDGVNLDLWRGEVLGLTGPNGSGKTTLARLIVGLIKPEMGEIRVEGTAGLVMQDPDHQLFMDTVKREITFGLDDYSDGDVEDLLETMKLHQLMERHPHSLSGGEKQRTLISVYLFRKPDLIIMDEPTTGMDLDNMKRLAGWIGKLKGMGVAMILISHDLEFLQMVADRTIMMDNGALVLPDHEVAGADSVSTCLR